MSYQILDHILGGILREISICSMNEEHFLVIFGSPESSSVKAPPSRDHELGETGGLNEYGGSMGHQNNWGPNLFF